MQGKHGLAGYAGRGKNMVLQDMQGINVVLQDMQGKKRDLTGYAGKNMV